jgi:hypothetical protein
MDPPKVSNRAAARNTHSDLSSAFLKDSFYAQGLRAGGEALFVVSQLGGEEVHGGFADGCRWIDHSGKVCQVV